MRSELKHPVGGVVVLTTHGRGGFRRIWLGSVADSLVRSLPVPLLVVRAEEMPSERAHDARIRRVLVATDGSEVAANAFRAALNLCRALDAACMVMRVVPWPVGEYPIFVPKSADVQGAQLARRTAAASECLSSYVEMASNTGVPVTTRVIVEAPPAEAILQCASEEDADLIVLGTHGQHRIARWLLGSVADKVIRGSVLPVLVCPEDLTFAVPDARLESEELVDVEIPLSLADR